MPSENVDDDDDDDNEDIPLSDLESLASEEKADVLPHQRLTINNTSALLKSLKSIALPWSSLPFSEHQSITSATPVTIASVDDDLNRELAFYKQSLDAVKQARSLLKKEGVPFSRPTDYFAEMVKSDEHMGKIKQKLTDEAANKKAAAEARKQRDLKKFGKAVQVAKLQERDRQKRETMDKINILKRSTFRTATFLSRPCGSFVLLLLMDLVNLQNEETPTPARQRKTIFSTSRSRTRRNRTANRPVAMPAAARDQVRPARGTTSAKSETRSLALAARSASPRAEMPSRARI